MAIEADGVTPHPFGLPATLLPGGRLAGYVLEGQIGAGGMAVVFRARDELLGRLAALKVIAPAMASDEEFRARFIRESRAVALVDEPHIIPVYAAGDADGVLFIATRYVAGGDLGALVRRSGGTLSPDRAVELIAQVASALDAAHAADLVHRDVKPGNILVDIVPGRPEHAYLSDFGISKEMHANTGLTATGQILGTLDYCAPEQLTGGQVDGRADQYALACVAFALLAGAPPFRRPTATATIWAQIREPAPAVSAVRAGLPSAADAVLVRALAKDPAGRYACCAEFAADLRAALAPAGEPTVWSAAGTPTARGGHDSLPPGPGNTLLSADSAAVPGHQRALSGILRLRHRTALIAAGAVVLAAAGTTAALTLPRPHVPPAPIASKITQPAATLAATITVPDGDAVNYARFSSDGAFLAAANNPAKGEPGRVYVWNAVTGKLRTTLTVSGGAMLPVSFGPHDATLIALFLGATSDTIYRFDLSTGARTALESGLSTGLTWTVSRDGNMLAYIADSKGDIGLLDLATHQYLNEITYPGRAIVPSSVGLDMTGHTVVASDEYGTTYVWTVTPSRVALIAMLHYNNAIPAPGSRALTPVIAPDGKTLEVWSNDGGQATFWDVATQQNITPQDARWPLHDDVNGHYSLDGRYFVTTGRDGHSVNVWDLSERSHIATITDTRHGQLEPLSLAPGGSEVAVGSANGNGYSRQVYLWKIARQPAVTASR